MICSWTSSMRWEETRYMCVSPLDITYFGPSGCCEELINKLCSAFTALAKGLGIQSLCQENPRIDTIVIQPEKKRKGKKSEGPTDWVGTASICCPPSLHLEYARSIRPANAPSTLWNQYPRLEGGLCDPGREKLSGMTVVCS